MKKQWISVKCGLSRDPKHRQAMGEGIWLFLHILDIASWEDGIVHDWKDEAAAEDMAMPVRTLREHRRKLDELGYITCIQKQYTQDIVIHNWTNPREYSGQTYNSKQTYIKTSPHKSPQGDTQGYIQGSTQDVTPTSNSNIKESNSSATGEVFKSYESNIGVITQVISVRLIEAIDQYPKEWITDAIGLAVVNNKRNWGYCDAILKRWQANGKDSGKKTDASPATERTSMFRTLT